MLHKSRTTKVILSIAGSDSSAGAGIAADIKTGAAFGVFVCSAITAVTAQNANAVTAVHPVSANALEQQLTAITEAHHIDAIKLGMLGNAQNLEVVAHFLSSQKAPVVIDPVLSATTGQSLWLGDNLVAQYRQSLLPFATVFTPNLSEAAAFLGSSVALSYEQMEQQAQALLLMGPKAVLLKGGHLPGDKAPDCLADDELTIPFSAVRIDTHHSHGSGCTLATAVAAGLAQGLTTKQAVAAAKSYIQGALSNSARLDLAANNGPIHHFYSYW